MKADHIVAVIGGAVAGSQAAQTLAEKGIGVVVFDQNERPYGKIEEGLPRWHDKMRLAEFGRIDEVYKHPLVTYVPKTRVGDDVSFAQLANEWGFSCVILANGAWRDRPLGIAGIDDCVGKGFYYQNPFMYWFNHYVEKDYSGPQCEIAEGAIVVGGGLASIDVVKVLMLETILVALTKRGIQTDINTLERRGADKILEENSLAFEQLDVKPCTLFYRREMKDMPLVAYPENATEEQKSKVEKTRDILLTRAMKKYFFKVQECSLALDKIVEKDRLVGLFFIRTKVEGGHVVDIPGSEFEVRAPLTISSIGSIPQPIPGIPSKGELYVWRDGKLCRLDYGKEVFGLGNVVTGKGNIAVSRTHSKTIAMNVSESGVGKVLSSDEKQILYTHVKGRQQAVGYTGDYDLWMKRFPPLDRQVFS